MFRWSNPNFCAIVAVFALLGCIAIGCAPRGWAHVEEGLEVGAAIILGGIALIGIIGWIGGGYDEPGDD